MPASRVVNSGVSGTLNLAPWPRYRENCCRGDQAYPQSSIDSANNVATMGLPDLSYPSNHMDDIDNFFLTDSEVRRPWIAMVDRTVYGDQVR